MGVNIGVGVRWVPAPLAAILVQPERENVASWVALSHFAGESEDGCFFWGEGDFWEFVVVGAESPDGVVAGFVHFEGDAGADEAA